MSAHRAAHAPEDDHTTVSTPLAAAAGRDDAPFWRAPLGDRARAGGATGPRSATSGVAERLSDDAAAGRPPIPVERLDARGTSAATGAAPLVTATKPPIAVVGAA
jgi:hypothetical protein